MKAQVIAPFIDRETGKRIYPGNPLPPGIKGKRLQKLQRAGCVVLDTGAGKKKSSGKSGAGKQERTADNGAAQSGGLFRDPDGSPPETGAGDNGQEASAEDGHAASTDPTSVEGDGGADGTGAQPDASGHDAGEEGKGPDDNSR